MRAETGREDRGVDESGGKAVAVGSVYFDVFSIFHRDAHCKERQGRGTGGCTACVRAGQRGMGGVHGGKGSHINCCVRTLVSCKRRRRRRRFLSRRTLTFVSDI